MGTNVVGGNGPAHEVKLTRDYYMCDHEVTQAEYEAVMGENPSMNKHMEGWPNMEVAEGEVQENRPVDGVSWIMAVTYCNKRSIAEGLTPVYSLVIDGTRTTDPTNWRINGLSTFYDDEKDDGTGNMIYPGFESWLTVEQNLDANGYRLPTEAEWEYAARAGDNTVDSYIYAGTNNFDEINDYGWLGYWIDEANHENEGRSHEVKKKKPNAWGLYDMLGNVTEYCGDWCECDSDGNYTGTDGVTVDPCENGNRDNYYYRGFGDNEEPSMCVRGGTVGNPDYNSETKAALTYRESYTFYIGSNEKGFRVVRTAK